MIINVDASNRIAERTAMRSMFEARKEVFVDLLGWKLPVLDGRYEIDQFDDAYCTYLLLIDAERRHLASARLLPTTRPTILATLFPELCVGEIPSGENVFEITRFCLSRRIKAVNRRRCRDMLVTALAEYALQQGITTYVGVAEEAWLQQILKFGWSCSRLGPTSDGGSATLGALRIDIAADTPSRLQAAGIVAGPKTPELQSRAA